MSTVFGHFLKDNLVVGQTFEHRLAKVYAIGQLVVVVHKWSNSFKK